MKAVVLHEYGGADRLHYEDAPVPQPGPTQVLIRLASTSVNPIDWKIRSGSAKDRIQIQFPYIPGRDAAGEVMSAGAEVSGFKPGQQVMGLTQHTYAEWVAVETDVLTVLPEGLDTREAGALPLVLTTGAQLIEHVHPEAGQTLLVTGAVGSVGRAAVFLARQYGAHVLAGVRSRQKEEAQELGAEAVIAIDDDREIERLPPLDAIADTVGGNTIAKLIAKLKAGGILGSVLGKPQSAEGRDLHVETFMAKPDPDRLQQLARAIARKEFRIPIVRTYPLSQAAEAQEFAEGGQANGKVLLLP